MARGKTKVILYGLGSIGAGIARLLVNRPEFAIIGAVDLDPGKAGKDIGEVIGLGRELGVAVSGNSQRILAKRAHLVIHATGSYFLQVKPQLEQIIRAGHNIVSTCEELADPWAQHPEAAARLDALAKKHKVTVLGTGINPGFAMDTLPVALTAVCQKVDRVGVRRVVDASKRRLQLQKKIGAGLTVATFEQLAERKELRHVGLAESVSLIARGLGWKLEGVEESIEPAIAKSRVVTDHVTVEPGFVSGVRQLAHGKVNGDERITLELLMAVDAGESIDEVWIEGTPSVHSVTYGIHGDLSTAAVVVNSARAVVEGRPGIATMLDLPIAHA